MTTITGERQARHAAPAEPNEIDRPIGCPEGPCEACGDEKSRKKPFVATGVYSTYALCADETACKQREMQRAHAVAQAARSEPVEAAEPPLEPVAEPVGEEDAEPAPVAAEVSEGEPEAAADCAEGRY